MAARTDQTTTEPPIWEAAGPSTLDTEVEGPAWRTLGEGATLVREPRSLRPRAIMARFALGVLAVFALVGLTGSYAAQRLAERESVNDAAARANILADAVVMPGLTPGLQTGREQAIRRFDAIMERQVLTDDVVRVKVWRADGRVLYADEPQLIGQTFALDEEQASAVSDRSTHAEISTLERSENAFEEGTKLVEVYRPIWFPDGTVGLFEIYTSYDSVGARTTELWRGFAAITLSSLLVLLLLLTPVVAHLLRRLRAYEQQRAGWLERAVDAGTAERRRIAGTLHDGPVQELAAAGFSVAAAAATARRSGEVRLADELDAAAGSVRGGIGALRTLVTDIHPAALFEEGLPAGLRDLAATTAAPELRIDVDVDETAAALLDDEQTRTMFRLAQESLRNCVKHAGPATVSIRLRREDDLVVLDVLDDGVGFNADAMLADPAPGHLGLRVLGDLASAPGMRAQVSTAPGRGTHWRFTQEVGR